MPKLHAINLASVAFFAVVIIGLGVLFMQVFESLPTEGTTLGIDNIFHAFEGWDIRYDVRDGLRNPPWSVLPLIPLGQLTLKQAWGLMVYFTIGVLLLSVPRPTKRSPLYVLSIFIVILSFPSLRNIADANLEGLVIAGALLVISGYRREHPYLLALGVLLVTAKPQAAFLLMLALAIYVLQTWDVRKWLVAGIAVLAVVLPALLWRGERWLQAVQGTYQAGSIIDISLSAALYRLGVNSEIIVGALSLLLLAVTLALVWRSQRTLSREKAGMLIAAGLLLAPYAAGNSIITVMAIGIIPLFLNAPRLGGLLIVMINLPFVLIGSESGREILYYQAYWWTLILLLTWGIIGWRVYHSEIQAERRDADLSSESQATA